MSTLTALQARRLKACISRHVTAQVELSWKGSTDPREWGDLEEASQAADKDLKEYITALREGRA